MKIDREILDTVRNSYGLGEETIRKINPYFYKQGINTATAYLTIWKNLPFSLRYKEIWKIMKRFPFSIFSKIRKGLQADKQSGLSAVGAGTFSRLLLYPLCLYRVEETYEKRGKTMKAGIITITTGENYGNRLQNYAVRKR